MLTFGTRGRLPVVTLPRVQAILDEQARHREQFEAFCRLLSDEELAEQVPGTPWTVHGYIAHLATIDSLIVPFLAPLVRTCAPFRSENRTCATGSRAATSLVSRKRSPRGAHSRRLAKS